MKNEKLKLNVIAFANTFALVDLILHPLFHIWGWYFPDSYQKAMHEFVIGLDLQVDEKFTAMFFVFWLLEAIAFWSLGFIVATLYNKLSNRN